jgi:predicted CXXCH cytochrome family protein
MPEPRAGRAQPAQTAEQQPVFYHRPYRERDCSTCHARETSFEVPTADREVCRQCHEPHYERRPTDWVHGPVAAGQCGYCHEGHKASVRDLLVEAQPTLCYRCHDRDRLLDAPYHAEADQQACARCHDPHFAGNRRLIVDSRTYERGGHTFDEVRSRHPKWSDEQCSLCHRPEASLRIKQGVDQQCLSCHGDLSAPGGDETLHAAVALGKCTICHAAHQSPLVHLVRPRGEENCYVCHDEVELQGPDHPVVNRADCLVCHHGHSAERSHLLRSAIPRTE